jgi:AraC-like DNA-binding protein
MSKISNIIQRRELEPLFSKALKIVKHYEKAANCTASVMGPDEDNCVNCINSICKNCSENSKACSIMHMEAIKEARLLGGAYIYACPAGCAFWTSPFYSGERFAGALLSGGLRGYEKNSDKVKALAQMMLVCADQISGLSFIQKNIPGRMAASSHQDEKDAAKSGTSSLDMERMLLASLRRGDNIEAKNVLLELINAQYEEAGGDFQLFRLKAIELAVLLTRAAANEGNVKESAMLETSSSYLKKIEECTGFDEIKELLFVITDQMSGMIFSFHGVCHFSALRKAERFIWDNYTRKISLREIAEASGLSASYFSTIFREEMGENLSNYLNRLRVEKAAAMLISTNLPISDVASACGFEDQSWFSKIFKNKTGFTPGKYREQGSLTAYG